VAQFDGLSIFARSVFTSRNFGLTEPCRQLKPWNEFGETIMVTKDRAEGYEILEVLIDGRWRQGAAGQSEPVTNPATGEILGHVPHVTADDLDEVLHPSGPLN
jgi:hypothetical protein